MRIIVLLLVVLAIGKVGAQSYIRQDSARATIITAYREHALAACRQYLHQVTDNANAGVDRGSQAYRPDHGTTIKVDLMIGNSNLDVRLWQTSHTLWSARYRDPFIIVQSTNPAGRSVCEYDINRGTVHARTAEMPRQQNG